MAFNHGKVASFKVKDSSTTLRDLSAYLNKAGLPQDQDVAEVTTFGSSAKDYVSGLPGGSIPIAGPWDPTVDGYLFGIKGLSKDFEYYPASTASGNVKYSGKGILKNYEMSSDIGAAAMFTAEFQITGVVSRSTLG